MHVLKIACAAHEYFGSIALFRCFYGPQIKQKMLGQTGTASLILPDFIFGDDQKGSHMTKRTTTGVPNI